jgi:hypothetical protein
MNEPTETTYLVWGCESCNRTYKVEPEVFKPNCRCKNPVPRLRPTIETQVHAWPRQPLRVVRPGEGAR